MVAFSLVGFAWAGGLSLFKNSSFNDALIPLYPEGQERPCAFVKVGSLDHDYQTRGFFRIGLLPVLRADRVEFEITDPDRAPEALAGLPPLFLSNSSCRSFEMHEVAIRFEGESTPRLLASLIRLTESGDWDLVDGCQLRRNGIIEQLPRSRLTVSGPEAGTIRAVLDGRIRTFRLFRPTAVPENPSK